MKFLNYYLGVNIFNERRERLSPSFNYLQCYSGVNKEAKGHLILQLEKVMSLLRHLTFREYYYCSRYIQRKGTFM